MMHGNRGRSLVLQAKSLECVVMTLWKPTPRVGSGGPSERDGLANIG